MQRIKYSPLEAREIKPATMHPRFTRQSIFVTSAVYISVCFPSPAAFLSLSASMPARRRPCWVLVDRNWGAKFSKSGSEVFMKVYSPSASHSSSSSYPPAPLVSFVPLFSSLDRFSSHRFPLALASSCCLTFAFSLSLSSSLLSGRRATTLLSICSYRRRTGES